MSKAKKQHYVPRFYLKAFATLKNSEYFTNCFDKSNFSQYKVNIKDVGCENYFYGTSKPSSQQVETVLADFDAKFTKVYSKLVSSASLRSLSWKEKEVFAQFITIQEFRTREMRERLRDQATQLKDWLAKKQIPAKMRQDVDRVSSEVGVRGVHSNFIIETITGGNDLPDMLLDLKWVLFRNETTIPFWTTDNPVSRYNPIDMRPYGNLGTLCRGIQIYFPLTPKLIIGFCDPIEYFFMPESGQCIKDNVHFYNTLNLSANTRHIFSINSDFSIAMKWLTENPGCMQLDRKRISTDVKIPINYNSEDYSYDPKFRYLFIDKYSKKDRG